MAQTAIILAAGQSTRMQSRRPKPLHEVCGRPMLAYILRACYEAGCSKVFVVVGHGRDQVIAQFADDKRITFVDQEDQLGTAHAVAVCKSRLAKFKGDVFILSSDAPLIRGQVLKTLLDAHRQDKAAASIATAILDNPAGYARLLRDSKSDFAGIVTDDHASPQQNSIREVFSGYSCVKCTELFAALTKLSSDRQREFPLHAVFEAMRLAGKRIAAVQAVSAEETLTVNTRQQLAEVDLVMQDRIQRQLRDSGVTIVNGFNTYIEDSVAIGADSVIHPFTFIGRDSIIGPDCTIGPFARIPRDSVLPEQAAVIGHPKQEGGLKL